MSDWLEELINGTDAVEETDIPKDLGEVTRLAQAMIVAEDAVKQTELELKSRKKRLTDIKERKIPDAFSDLGIIGLPLASGRTITLKNYLNASIPAAAQEEVFAALRDSGHDEIIKTEVKVAFGKGQDELSKAFLIHINGWNRMAETSASTKTSVHPQTLSKFVRDARRDGEVVPEGISVHSGQIAVIK